MSLSLHRPLCFFDLETTGVNVVTDRIVEIAILKLLPGGIKRVKHGLSTPEFLFQSKPQRCMGLPTIKWLTPRV